MTTSGLYHLFFAGQSCGEETFTVTRDAHGIERASGRNETRAPHPLPGAIEWSATANAEQRLVALEIAWRVGERTLRTTHAAEGARWRVGIAYGADTRTQEGDYPPQAHVVFGSPVLQSWVLRRFALAPGAAHVFPALVVGPPWMAVEPGRHELRCTARETRDSALGARELNRIEWLDPGTPDAGELVVWSDAQDVVHEVWEGAGATAPSAKLVELRRD